MFALFFCLFNLSIQTFDSSIQTFNWAIQTFNSAIQTFNLVIALCTITKNRLSPGDQNDGVGLGKERQIFRLHPLFAYYALGERT